LAAVGEIMAGVSAQGSGTNRSVAAERPTPAAQTCIECHKKETPGIVGDWQLSKHARNGVECSACHGEAHTSAADATEARIPTPETCGECHAERVAEFKEGKHALAWTAMKAMPTAHYQPMALMEGMKGCGGCR
jgi:hypothetical protein